MRHVKVPLRHLAHSLALCALFDTIASGAAPQAWPDDFPTRVEALALLQTLNAELLSHDSATATLQHWCADHRLAEPPRIVATPLHTEPRAATAEQRALLRVAASEPVSYRHVQVRCGALVLSEAENWYLPARLTAAMNHELETTDTPFGAVVRSLQFRRRTLEARLLWSPLPSGWDMGAAVNLEPQQSPLQVPAAVLEHHAVLSLPDGTPFSLLVETYSGNVLAFPAPQRQAAPAAH